MKITKILLLMSMVAIVGIYGCIAPQTQTQFTATLLPVSGHPPFNVTITASPDGVLYTYNIPGLPAVETSSNTLDVVVTTWPWSCNVSMVDENGATFNATVSAGLTNERPVAHDLWITNGAPPIGSVVLMDLRYLAHGCINGTVQKYTGMEDPDFTVDGYSKGNDGFTYNIRVQDVESGEWETIWTGPLRAEVGSGFFTSPVFYWCAGWTDPAPPYPYAVWSPTSAIHAQEVKIEDCYIPVLPPGDTVIGEDAPNIVKKRIEVSVKEWGSEYRWVYIVDAVSTDCSP